MATISNTAGGSGSYITGQVTGGVTLFTTPNTPNAIFIVYLTMNGTNLGNIDFSKQMIGPNAPFVFPDNSGNIGTVSWNWVQMEIS